MIKAGVIGHPISHSKSPFIHGYWLKQFGIDGVYQTYDIAPEYLKEGIDKLVADGLAGFNVTLPHKQTIQKFCSTLSDEALTIGAVNTVTIGHDGQLHGHNTDAFGFTQNLLTKVPNFDAQNCRAAVLGAGGASRAIFYALKTLGVPFLSITNRTRSHAEDLASVYDATVYDWNDRHEMMKGINLVINTTSLGMKGQEPLDIKLDGLTHDAIVYDIVYVPLQTPLLQQAERIGAKTVTGIGMLLHQARPGFESWFGRAPQVDDALEKIIIGM